MRRNILFILAAAAALTVGSTAQAKPAFVKKAKEMGFDYIQNCQSCHVDKLPKKDAKGEPFSEIGKFLMDEKGKHKAEEIDLNWLKGYKK